MEYIQAFLFTSKYLFGRNDNIDIFFLFSFVVLIFYALKRHDKLKLIAKIVVPIVAVSAIMAFAYPWAEAKCCIDFIIRMLLDITLMVFAAYNCRKWNIGRFVEAVAIIQGVETIAALLMPDSSLWITEQMLNQKSTVSRLALFYSDAGTMAFASGIALVILVYMLIKEEIFWKYAICMIVMLADLFLSYGVGGIACSFVGIIAMLGMTFIHALRIKDKKTAKKYGYGTIIVFVLTVAAIALNSTYLGRIKGILADTDKNLNFKLISPLNKLGEVLYQTHGLGVGFGNGRTHYTLSLTGSYTNLPNSFIEIIAEGGIFGIFLVLAIVAGIGFYCFKYGKMIDKALFIYIISFQMIGGNFTDPTNFFVYGWIIGDSIYHKIKMTGYCRQSVFMPKTPDHLKIAEIGHKRIPGREGGIEVVVEEIGRRFVGMGHSVDAYNRSGQHVAGAEHNMVDYDKITEYEGIKIIRIPTIQRKGIAAVVYSLVASIYVIFKDYDVLHYHAEGPCLFLWIPSMFGIRTIVTIHGLDWQRSAKWGSLGSTVIKLGEKIAALFADEIIVLSKHVQQYFLDTYGRVTHLIPNGVNRPDKRKAELIKDKYGLVGQDYFLVLARLTREKRLDFLIGAFANVKTDKKLVIAGGASDSDAYVEELHELGAKDSRVIFTGFVQGQEMDELYSNAYVYCLPSELEGMPLTLLEAMSYGNCCLTSDIAENTDVVRSKGLSFVTNDEKSLTQELQKLADNPETVKKYQSEASEYICQRYNWDEVAKQTERLYKNDTLV